MQDKQDTQQDTHLGGDEVDISAFKPLEFNDVDIPDSCFNLVIGSRRSGKSFLTNWIPQSMQKSDRAFTHVFLFSPTDSGFEGIPRKYRYRDITQLQHIMDQQKMIKKHNLKQKKKEGMVRSRVCVVLGDCACMSGAETLRNSKALEWCALNGRHLGDCVPGNGVSIFVLSQSLTRISRAIRLNCDLFIMNAISSSIEAEMILAECFFVCNTRRDAKRHARDTFETLVKSKDWRFIAGLNHISNKRSLPDYIRLVDAEKKKDFQFFGSLSDDEGDSSDDEGPRFKESDASNSTSTSGPPTRITVEAIDRVRAGKAAAGGRTFFSRGGSIHPKHIPY